MKFDLVNLINHITQCLFSVFIVGLVLIFSPWQITDIFNTPKWLFLTIFAILFAIIWGLKMLTTKQPNVIAKKYTIILGGFFFATIISMLLNNPNKVVAFLENGTIILSSIVIIFTLSNIIELEKLSLLKDKIYWILLSSAGILSLWEMFNIFNISNKIFGNKLFTTHLFTPLGSQFTLLVFLIGVILATLPRLLNIKQMNFKKILGLILSSVIFMGIILSTLQILPNKSAHPNFLPINHGWSIAVDQLKNVRSFLIGFGPNNFETNFNFIRPANLNNTKYWQTNFTSSSNEILNIFSTLGILGLLPFLLLLITLIKKSLKMALEIKLPLYFTIISLFLFPANISIWLLLIIFTILILATQEKVIIKDIRIPQLLGLMTVLLMLVLGFFTSRVALAEIYYGKGLHAFTMNNVQKTILYQEKAANLNPYSSEYRKTYSRTNLTIANALASKKNVSDKEKDQISQLINNSIKEAKAAVVLRPNRSDLWNNLATTYVQLSNIVPEAKNWTVQAYVQTIKLEPTNPILRLQLAQFLIANKALDQAVTQLNIAASLKPDYANIYYNLAYVFSVAKQYPQAYINAQKALSLLSPQHPQYQKVKKDVENLYKLVPDEYKQNAQSNSANPKTAPQGQLNKPQQPPKSNTQIEVKDAQQKNLQPPNGSDQATLQEIIPSKNASDSGAVNQ